MPPFPPHQVYSRYLTGVQGYPLWTPQLNTELPDDYRREGLKIGDVGIVSPIDGSFDVLFNITLPRNEQPDPKLVREGFTPVIPYHQLTFATQDDAVSAHGVIRSASVELTSKRDDPSRDQTPSRADYEFSLSMGKNGAVLILPEGAQSRDLREEKTFLDEAVQHAVDWYKRATEDGGRLISDNSLYLITGFHKAHSWSLGAAGRSVFNFYKRRSAKFKVGQIHEDGVTAEAYSWDATHGFEGRVGPMHPYRFCGERVPNQTVFIRGFRITVNEILFLKTVSVEVRQRTRHKFGFRSHDPAGLPRGGTSESTSSSTTEGATDNTVDQDYPVNHARLNMDTRITVDHIPEVSQTFHPGDSINRYMLRKEPRAIVALTHDSLWIEMLRMGLLEFADFSRGKRLQKVLSKHYRTITEDGAVYLQRGDAFESQHNEHSSTPDRSSTTSMDSYAPRTLETATLQAQAKYIPGRMFLDIDRPPPPPDLTPNIVQTDQFISEAGAFGDVCKCVYMSDAGPIEVAVKAYRLGTQLSDQGKDLRGDRMLHQELEIWRRLNHKNIVPFLGITYGFGMRGSMSSVSLWMPNGSLHSFLQLHRDYLTVAHRLQLLLDIANGLSYLHSCSIVHGDLNPNNVLLDAEYTARLTDFGCSFLVGDTLEALEHLQWGSPRLGALRWMAPEVVISESPAITTQRDIYSFGSMAFTVLSGQQPWSEFRSDAQVVLQLAKGGKPRRPPLPLIEDRHWELIQHCWSPIESRPSADDIVLSIQQFLSSYPPPQLPRDVPVPLARSESGIIVSHDLHSKPEHLSQDLPEPGTSDAPVFHDPHGTSDHLSQDLLESLPDLTTKIVKIDKHSIGVSGNVCRCQYISDVGAKEVAVKPVRLKLTLNKNTGVGKPDEIRRELVYWTRLNHPNIVPFLGIAYGFGGQENVSLVSLWMSNGPLQDLLEEYKYQLTTTHRLCLLSGIANGLLYLHSIPIIHGCLSPYNVLLDNNYNACLSDFGYASLRREIEKTSIGLQDSVVKLGALWWTAPELVTGPTPHNTESDIYSFGSIALQVLSGKRPWVEINEIVALKLQLTLGHKPGRPDSHSIEHRHWELIEACWSSPRDRPSSVYVASGIQKLLDAHPPPRPLHDLLVVPDLTDKIHKADEEYILHGSFSDVYKYLHDSDIGTKEVAVKVFRIKFTVGKERSRSQVGKRVHHTLNAWRALDHPNIVQFFGIAYGFGRQANASLVSLWMPNGTLELLLDRHTDQLVVAHRLQLLLDVANGLQYLHSIPIIHGDLSPRNILLDCNYNARLTDFDYASFIGNRDVYLGASTLRGGALRWTAPELITEDIPEHTTKNDIYPFGNLAYLVLSGQYPWSEIRQDAVVLLRLAQGRKASRPKSRPIENHHWGLIERCWSSVQDRPPAAAVVYDIQKFLGAYAPPKCLRDLLAVPAASKTSPHSSLMEE